jgi:hypothetical protein
MRDWRYQVAYPMSFAALIVERILSNIPESDIATKMRQRYATPLPTTATFTKQNCSSTYADVVKIQEEFGFEYAAVVGSLIYLMNTYIRLNYVVRKLARFMQYPGRKHFKMLLHLLRHLQCHRCRGGLKFYSDMQSSPLINI